MNDTGTAVPGTEAGQTLTGTIVTKPLPGQLAAAVAAVMTEIKRLEKGDDNKFANYKFTSVDDYKDMIRPLMAKRGLMACVDQVRFSTFSHTTEKGKESLHCKFDFELWLEHISGEKGKPEGSTVCLAYVGAQTSGQARSYAMKEWLKSKFLASSGDTAEDADSHDLDIQLSKQQARGIHAALTEELRGIASSGTEADLTMWSEKNSVMLNAMPKDWVIELRHEYKLAQISIGAREKGEKIDAENPMMDEWLDELENQMAVAENHSEIETLWLEHEDTIAKLGPTDEARANRIKREQLERLK